ncbi:SAM-dependent methyltransferase [Allopusillimonas ginsengisoli]|uniref:SAM-dependent methyltransferase n=1 Tax=Allopusillimonas ginsengisoli TaxID=453575 RepID=UPI00101F8D4E|nr:methyltransferase domain-containing protein [Allopusillimonas ginsengisoli]TEA70302.1 methyltransferase domain-containing protein [Allopusillimonas ginsengisoli]
MLISYFRRHCPGRACVMVAGSFLIVTLGFLPSSAAADTFDVPFVPTPPEVVERMLNMAEVGPSDRVIDLGSGDGRIAIAAVKDRAALSALGVDLNPVRVEEAKANAKDAGVSDRVEFRQEDLFDTDFSNATVLTMYLLPNVNMRLRPKVLDLAAGTRVVSHAFDMDDWESDDYARLGNRDVYMWVVPAKVAGAWQLDGPEGSLALDVEQTFQHLSGIAQTAKGHAMPVRGKLRGKEITLQIGDGNEARHYTGTVQADTMAANPATGNVVQGWRAVRR